MKNGKQMLALVLAMMLLLSLGIVAGRAETAVPTFTYEHDPLENPTAMRDIVENPAAVYGFSPKPDGDSTLKEYADSIDWTDPDQVADARAQRQAYHDSMQELYEMIMTMVDEDQDVETIARKVSNRRNEIRLEVYIKNHDLEGLDTVRKRNLETYGDEFGPNADALYEKYGSWDMVLYKALGTNAGMDACLGFYDEFYYLYDLEEETGEESTESDDDDSPRFG